MGTIAKFYDLETIKLIADGEKVSLFTKHPGTLGSFREARLREYLREHVPDRYTLASGFISHHDRASDDISDRSSRQIDCLLYDKLDRPALIESDAFVCVEPSCAVAFVEVKSTLQIGRSFNGRTGGKDEAHPFASAGRGYRWSGTLVEALANVASAVAIMREIDRERSSYHASVIAYDGDGLGLLDEALTSGELQKQLGISSLDSLPDCICVLTAGWWGFAAYSWNDVDPAWDEFSYDSTRSWLTKVIGKELGGAPLQLFTAYLNGTLEGRAGSDRTLGGLRSGVGRSFEIENVDFPLPSPSRR